MLALIAGMGALPKALYASQVEKPLVCSLQGFLPDGLSPDVVFRLEQLGTFLIDLKARGVSEVCFAGAIRRPQIDSAAIDADTMPLVPIISEAIGSGDDGALRAIMSLFEDQGFTIRSAEELAPDLLPRAGVLGRHQVLEASEADAARAERLIEALSEEDVGQACIVANGQVLAIEAVFGTDWMLASVKNRPDGKGGIFYKSPKLGQDRRADLPLIGPDTAMACAEAGLNGIVIEAGGVMMLDQENLIARCDAAGLFLWVRERTI
ncbi:DUF1009 domain-containing protein [Sulfitobacter sp. BDSS02]|nr:DUF1009 domain-containing protein [Sulfitobacter sp. BDSS02]MBR9849395.1 LpxI family protein [Paracoccaceae bacterium]